MKIEVKNVQHYPALSEETNAFTANVYINGKLAAKAENHGRGGNTSYAALSDEGLELVKAAEQYCRTLPDRTFGTGAEAFTYKMDLECYIDDLVTNILVKREMEKENKRFQRELDATTAKGIAWGTEDSFRAITYKIPLTVLLARTEGRKALITAIKEKIIPQLQPGEMIRNTNIPEDILKEAGLSPGQYVQRENNAAKKSQKIRRKGL